ncbi:MAG: hypothetical protein AAF409_14395 [Pseudomonadota bacterium]
MTIRHLVAAALIAAAVPAAAQDIETVRVQFEPGASAATIEDKIAGYQIVDYLLGAVEGQAANISMASQNPQAYFNILAPGSDNEAIHIGSVVGNQFEGMLPASGDYRVRVYLMRAAARRGETAAYRLEMIIAPESAAAGVGVKSASRGGGGDFGAARGPDGEASVVATRPDGAPRTPLFESGASGSSDLAGATAGWESTTRRHGYLTAIGLGPDRYESPDAVVFGG